MSLQYVKEYSKQKMFEYGKMVYIRTVSKNPTKIFLPVCEECLEPFELYDKVYALDAEEGTLWQDMKLYHHSCIPLIQIAFNDLHRERTS